MRLCYNYSMSMSIKREDITEVVTELTKPLETDNAHNLMQQASIAEALLPRIGLEKRKYEKLLAEEKSKILPEIAGTVQEKEIQLEAQTAELNQQYSVLKDLEKQLFTRLSLAQSFLKYMSEELKRNLRDTT